MGDIFAASFRYGLWNKVQCSRSKIPRYYSFRKRCAYFEHDAGAYGCLLIRKPKHNCSRGQSVCTRDAPTSGNKVIPPKDRFWSKGHSYSNRLNCDTPCQPLQTGEYGVNCEKLWITMWILLIKDIKDPYSKT